MVRFRIHSGRHAGQTRVVGRFRNPLVIGRSSSADFEVRENGVWDRHAELRVNPSTGFSIHALPDTTVYVNGASVRNAELQLGDVIEIGSCKMEFHLDRTCLKSLTVRESLTWALAAALLGLQVGIINWLVR